MNKDALNILLLNARGMSNKLGEIKLTTYIQKPDIFCITETWLNKHEPKFINYSSVWKHRVGVGGGLGILLRFGIQFTELNLTPYPNGLIEFLAINLVTERYGNIKILCTYNPNKPVTPRKLKHYIQQLGNNTL